MTRRVPRRLRALAALSLAALLPVQALAPSSAAEAEAGTRPDLLVSEYNGSLLRLSSGDEVPEVVDGISYPLDSAVAPDGDLYVVTQSALYRIPSDGGETEQLDDALPRAAGVAVDSDEVVYTTDHEAGILYRYDPVSGARTVVDDDLAMPEMISVDRLDRVLLADYDANTVYRYAADGTRITLVDEGLVGPFDVAEAPDGSLVVSERGQSRVSRVDLRGSEPVVTAIATVGQPVGVTAVGDTTQVVSNGGVVIELSDNGSPSDILDGLRYPWGLSPAEFVTGPYTQTITFTSGYPDASVGDTYRPTAQGGGSGQPVTFSIAESSADACSYDASTGLVTFTSVGTCRILADQAGDAGGTYAAAPTAQHDVGATVSWFRLGHRVTSAEPANDAGWRSTPATVTFTCRGGLAPYACPDPVTVGNTPAEGKVVKRRAVDALGTVRVRGVRLFVDTTAPTLTVALGGEAPYARTARPVRCGVSDAHSGADGRCTVSYGSVSTDARGRAFRSYSVSGRDVAGNTAGATGRFRVRG